MTERVAQLSWVPHHLDDLDADFARFFRVDWEELDGPRFFTRAQRVTAYGGVMTAVVEEAREAVQRELEELNAEGEDTLPALPDGAVVISDAEFASTIR